MKLKATPAERRADCVRARLITLCVLVATLMSACGGDSGSGPPASGATPGMPAGPPLVGGPANASVVAQSAAKFFVWFNNPPATVQWEISTNGGANWTSIDGAVDNIYITPPTTLADNGNRYRAVVSRSVGSVVSAPAVLTVFAPAARPWQTAVPISAAAGGSAPQVKMDAEGNAIGLWMQITRSTSGVVANRYDASTGRWGTPVSISQETSYVDSASMAIDASGNAIVVCSQANDSGRAIVARRYSAVSGTWSAATVIGSGSHEEAYPRVAMDAVGNAIAVWQLPNGAKVEGAMGYFVTGDIVATRYDASKGTWSLPAVIDAGNRRGLYPRIVMDASGNAIAAWTRLNGSTSAGQNDIVVNHYSAATGVWGTAAAINSAPGLVSAEIAMDASGNAVAAWSQSSGGSYSIWTKRYSAPAGTWGPASVIPAQGAAWLHNLVMDPAGNSIVLWSQANPSELPSLLASRYSAARSGWAMATVIAESVGLSGIAMDGHGNALVAWQRGGESTSAVLSRRYDVISDSWDQAAAIGTSTSGVDLAMAMSAAGVATVLWWHETLGLQANRYE